MYQYVLAIHIIFVVCWMAGLFYMVRLFIYHTEAQEKPELERKILSDQFQIMERKLWYIITVPSMVFVVLAGITLLFLVPAWLSQPWMQIKLAFVVGLLVYHFICQSKMKQMAKGIFTWSSTQLRVWNEVATIILFAIVFLVVLKNTIGWVFGIIGLLAFTTLIMLMVKVYKNYRTKNNK